MEELQGVLLDEYDIDHLLSSFSDHQLPLLPITDSGSPVSISSDPIAEPEPIAASMGDLERFLMSDGEENQAAADRIEENFFDGLFVHELATESDGSNQVRTDGDDSVEKAQEKERDSDDDPVAQKIRRYYFLF
jgi:hypothetical protein